MRGTPLGPESCPHSSRYVRRFVIITFASVDEILWCYHSNETSSAVLSHGAFFINEVVTVTSVAEILWCYHPNETFSAEPLILQKQMWIFFFVQIFALASIRSERVEGG